MKINKQHPLAIGLVGAFNGADGFAYNHVTGAATTRTSIGTIVKNRELHCSAETGGSNKIITDIADLNGDHTFVFQWVRSDGPSIDEYLMGASDATNSEGTGIAHRDNSSGLWWFTTAEWSVNVTNTQILVGETVDIAYSFSVASGIKVYANGAQIDSSATGGAQGTVNPVQIWERDEGWNGRGQGSMPYAYVYDRTLTQQEINRLQADPWQIFKAQPIIGAHQLPTHVDYGMVKMPWTSQPPPGTPLDLDNPLTRGLDLVDAMDDPKGQDAAGNYPRHPENDAIPRVSRQLGRAQYWDVSAGVDSVRRGYSIGNDFSGIPEITVASLHRVVSAQSSAHFFVKKDRSGFLSWELYKTGTGGNANKYWLFVNTSGGTYSNDAGATVDDYDPHLVVGVFKADSHLQVWLDGALYASDADTPTGNITTRSWAVAFAGEDDGAAGINQFPQDEEMFLNCVWSRALSDAEIKAFSANPWQIFQPKEIMVPMNEDLPDLVTFEKPWEKQPR